MITYSDSFTTYDLGKYFVVLPQVTPWNIDEFILKFKAKLVPEGFHYSSDNNEEWETIDSIRSLIKEHLYSDFNI
jgi:hypothetical protein